MDSIIDSLIELISVAQRISDNGFDVNAFFTWKSLAFLTLLSLLGPFNYYTRRFCRFTGDSSRSGLMAGEGILVAVKEHLCRGGFACESLGSLPIALNPNTEDAPWVERKKRWYSLDSIRRLSRDE